VPADKAPSPDGFTSHFYKVYWLTIKEDIMVAVSALWRRDFRNFRLLSTAYITLIPKTVEAIHAKDFRPISLIHSFTKLITKILANRLAARLEEMVSTNQSAFIKGMFIQDNFLLVQQTACFLHSQKQPQIILKLDISKAFDSVSWVFLLEVLGKLEFGGIWRDHQRAALLVVHSDPIEWNTGGVHYSQAWIAPRGSPLTHALHFGYGYP
jgi:hypothetical protein